MEIMLALFEASCCTLVVGYARRQGNIMEVRMILFLDEVG